LPRELSLDQSFNTAGEFWRCVEAKNENFGFIRDIANASKHVTLTRHTSTSMTHMANTSIQTATWDNAKWDNAKWDEPYAISKDGETDVLFDTCAKELFAYWTQIINKLDPESN